MATISYHPHADQVKVASGLDLLVGIACFISAFAVPMSYELAWSNAIVGVIVVILAATRAFGAYAAAGISWLNLVLGIWVLITPWVLAGAESRMQATIINNVIIGALMIVLAGWSALATETESHEG